MVTQFVSAMDNIVIARYNPDGSIGNFIQVNTYLSPKERIFHEMKNASRGHLVLPATSFRISGVARDGDRQVNKNHGFLNRGFTGEDGFEYIFEPNPINIEIEMGIITRFQRDLEQIINNFVPYFQPNIFVSTKEPHTDKELRHKVIWNENISITNPEEITPEDHYRYIAETGFTIETELYKATRKKPIPAIQGVSFSFIPTCENIKCLDDDDYRDYLKETNTEVISCKFFGDPEIKNLVPDCVEQRSIENTTFCLEGDLCKIDCLFLSSSVPSALEASGTPVSSWDFFQNASIASAYPAFEGIPIFEFKQISDNLVCFNLPEIPTGEYSFVVVNDAGYSVSHTLSGKDDNPITLSVFSCAPSA